MIRLAMAALAVTLTTATALACAGCARPWSESTGQPGFTERAPLVEPLASRIDRGGWMISDQARVWKVMESQSGFPERHIGYVVGANYRQVRGGPGFKMYKVTTLDREDQIGHVDALGRAVRYEPQRDGTFRPEPMGTNQLDESVAAIFGTNRHVRLEETSERRLAFEAMDLDGDGMLVPSETAGFGEQLQNANANGDAGVDFEEFELIDRL